MTAIPPVPELTPGQTVVVTKFEGERHYGTYLGPADRLEGLDFDIGRVQVPGFINSWTMPLDEITPTTASRDMVPGDLIPLARLKAAFEKPFLGSLWTHGDSGMLTPYVCEASFGDGLKLLKLATIHQRPNYHMVRVDSGWDEDDLAERIDDILTAIEDECGPAGIYLDEPCESCRETTCQCSEDYSADEAFPALDDRDGCSWSVMSFADVLRALEREDPSPPSKMAA